ncbi:hypothetical protein OEZ85_012340 [Tetradesmus obliquus]|uniref:Major facilitator superfamily (MFS) profile domain-containing protein n=1 Tax=Tetradesmus obliquus TaxID=3088 RepID=A0ABY8TT34_TETOB|nr:hypothetical protein OEZ85_012340 [Tetradesmus obliquus]
MQHLQLRSAAAHVQATRTGLAGKAVIRPLGLHRPPIFSTQLRRRGDALVSRFLPKDGDKDKAAAELEQQGKAADVPAAPQEPDAAAAAAAAAAPYSADFVRRRLLVFAGIVIGYTTFYLTRGSLTYSAPAMVADPALGFNLTHIGTMTSIFPMAYGVSKFAAGVLSTGVSARLLHCTVIFKSNYLLLLCLCMQAC